MKTVEEAQNLILERAAKLAPALVNCDDALGLVLAEEIVSDIDSPPHDRSVVDGYAVHAADFATGGGTVRLRVLEEVTAGQVPTVPVSPGYATRIMTGAPIPQETAGIVMIEKSRLEADGNEVELEEPRFSLGMNITRQGTSLRKNSVVLQPGRMIRGIEQGLLAEVGREQIQVIPQPKVAILATGNELVPVSQFPAAGQIRNSNGPMLAGLVRRANGRPIMLGVAQDTRESLREKITAGLNTSDVLVLSGGVSAGVLDLVPGTLAELGVVEVFHKINLKPGKPLWFGVRQNNGRQQLVFGLPGNPVSSLVCFELFVRPAVAKLLGQATVLPEVVTARLTSEHRIRGDRRTYWPAVLAPDASSPAHTAVTPLPWQGSGDLRTLTDANALAVFDTEGIYAAGTEVSAIRI